VEQSVMGGYREGIGPVAGGTAVSTPVEQPFPLRIECWSDGHWKNGDKQRISARWVASRLLELSEACHQCGWKIRGLARNRS